MVTNRDILNSAYASVREWRLIVVREPGPKKDPDRSCDVYRETVPVIRAHLAPIQQIRQVFNI